MEFDLFVVYAVADRDFVHGYLLPALNLAPSRVQLVDQLTPGASLVSEIERGVSRSRFTIAVLSAAYLVDRWAVFGEQLASYLSIGDGRVIPLHLAECTPPLHLRALVSLDFTDRAQWDSGATHLRARLQTTEPTVEQIPCPYPGMRPFTANEANWFFGRNKEIDDLIGRLDHQEREIYVIGPSGSGKSSLVQAGLLHELDAGTSRLGRSFVVRTMRPGERPTDRLAHALEGDLATPEATISALVARHLPAQRALVFVDQLEELFTLADAAERQRFVATLRALRVEPRCYLLLAFRADFYGALMESALWPDLAGRMSRVEIAPLRGTALVQAITAPARQVGVYLEARLCDRLVVDAADEPGVLPHVQETLRLLWDQRRQRFLGLADYEALGDGASGLHMAIARHADATMRAFSVAQQTIAYRLLLRLVSFGEGRADTRRQQKVQALRSAADDGAEFLRVLQRLVNERLVTVDGDEAADDALTDLSHEALITAWPEFQKRISSRRADEQRRRRLEAKVGEWIERGRGKWSLLDLVELSEAEQWMQSDAARELGYASELLSLVKASRGEIESVERQRRRQAFRAVAVFAVLAVLVATSILGFVAWRQWQEAQRRLGMNYLYQGQALVFGGHPMQALPYFAAAKTEAIETPIPSMLLAQASRSLPLVTFVGHGLPVKEATVSRNGTREATKCQEKTERRWGTSAGRPMTPAFVPRGIVNVAVFSPDGTRLVTASNDQTARIWDVSTGIPITLPLEHECAVAAAAFSPDGMHVVTASNDQTARVWNAWTGRPMIPPLGHRGIVYAAAFSPDGRRVVTASEDKTARVWDASTGKPVTPPLVHQDEVYVAAFAPDGTRVVTASKDRTARVWDVSTGKPVTPPLAHQGVVNTAAFSPDGTRVVTASFDQTARVWDASTGTPLTAPLAHQGFVYAATFSPDGRRVVTASGDQTARIWDASTGRPLTKSLVHQGQVNAAAFSPDGRHVVTASQDKTARVWDVATGKPVTPPLEHQDRVSAAVFNPDGTRIVTASDDKMARVWDASTGPVTPPLEHQGFVYAAAFSPDGTRVVTASFDETARVWDASTGTPVTPPLEHQGFVFTAAFNPDGTRVVTASEDQTAQVWDASTGVPVTPPLEHQGQVNAAAFSPDGTRVVTASFDKTARVWDATTGKPVTPPLEHQSFVLTAAFSPDGTHVVTSSGMTARVWDASTGKPVTPPLGHQDVINAATFSPDGTRVVTASFDRTARIWDVATGKPMTPPLEHQGLVYAASFSPDGTRVVTASDDKTARVWDATTGTPMTPSLEHQGLVYAASFSPDGRQVVTASQDKTTRVWDVATGKLVTQPLEHQGAVRTAAFSPDGKRVVTASEDKTARVWVLSDMHDLEDWHLLAGCSPFAVVNGVLMANPDPLRVCPLH
jgi:WD40 repeat protein